MVEERLQRKNGEADSRYLKKSSGGPSKGERGSLLGKRRLKRKLLQRYSRSSRPKVTVGQESTMSLLYSVSLGSLSDQEVRRRDG